jgi:cardiolipin synthase A/B
MTEDVELIKSGPGFFLKAVKMISEAKKEIWLQCYIFEQDESTKEVIDALLNAAARKCDVKILLDGFGSKKFPELLKQRLIDAGIKIRFFGTIFSRQFLLTPGRRLHHKILVCDNREFLLGGINFSGRYKGTHNQLPWLDYAVFARCHQAENAATICSTFWHKYIFTTRDKFFDNCSLKLIRNDGYRGKYEILRSNIAELKKAKKEVVIVSAYFLPGRLLRKAIRQACERGVRVRIVVAGQPDVPLVASATQYLYKRLLKAGVEIYEWHHSVMHAKIVQFDEKTSSIGSYNWNNLSSVFSIELNALVQHSVFNATLQKELESVIVNSIKVNAADYLKGNLLKGANVFYNWMSYRILKFVLRLLSLFPGPKGIWRIENH